VTRCRTKHHLRWRARHSIASQLPAAPVPVINARSFFEPLPGLGSERLESYIENSVAKYTATHRSLSSSRGVE
jgi:hypothetical protein